MKKTNRPLTIHFVCRGNTYRSRLAAAYFYTLVSDRFKVTSSGINADKGYAVVTKMPYAKAIADEFHLTHGMTKRHTQTTSKVLEAADVIVFMNKDVYEDARKEFNFDTRKCLVWHVSDIKNEAKRKAGNKHTEELILKEAEVAFKKIRSNCDELKTYLTHTSWVDIVDHNNEPVGLRLPMAWATDRGLWTRGIHVVAQTADGKYLVEKRSKQIVFAPSMLEITLGGGIDSGEHPLQAVARETHEELGIKVPEKYFRPLFMYKHASYHPHYNKYTKCHIYVYHVKLPVHSSQIKPQFDEVAEVYALSKSQIKRLLHAHRLKHFGKLNWDYKLSNKAVAYSSVP